MGKKILAMLIVAVIVSIAGYNIYQSMSEEIMSDFMLANVEALADNESGDLCRTNIDYTAICNYYDLWDPCPCGF